MDSQNTSNFTWQSRELFSPAVCTTINALYTTTSMAGFFNNAIAIMVLYRENTSRKIFNILLLNLFIADMFTCIAIQPYIWINFTKISGSGSLPGFICAASVGLIMPMICMTPNAITLFIITLLRYSIIVRNYRGFFVTSVKFIKGFCICTWIIGMLVTIPGALSFRYNHTESICYRKWPQGTNASLYSSITTSIFLVGLLMSMTICYAALAIHVWKQSRDSILTESAAERSKRRVTFLLGSLILAVLICWCPWFMVWFLGRTLNYFPNNTDGEFQRQRWLRIAMISAIINPFLDPLIYAYTSPDFRIGLRKLIQHFLNIRKVDIAMQNSTETNQ